MSHEFSVVIERDEEGYYVGSVPALPGCYTQARSLDELVERIEEEIALRLEVHGNSAVTPPKLEFDFDFFRLRCDARRWELVQR